MLKILGVIGQTFLVFAGGIALILLVGFIFFGDSRGCGGDSEAASYARSLSQERLSKLYKDMEWFYNNETTEVSYYPLSDEANIPTEFADLNFAVIDPKLKHIMVEGCFDHYLYLFFKGFNGDGKREIVLAYGEVKRVEEVLWKGPDEKNRKENR